MPQSVYVHVPQQTTPAISSYRRRQSTVCGALLIFAGVLGIILCTVEIAYVVTALQKNWTWSSLMETKQLNYGVGMENAIRSIICAVVVSKA